MELQFIQPLIALDHFIQQWFTGAYSPGITSMFQWVTGLGSAASITSLAVLVTFVAVMNKCWKEAAVFDLGLTFAYLLMSLLKINFGRIRPLGEHLVIAAGYSMPSGHAMLAVIAYGFTAYLLHKHLPGIPVNRLAIPTIFIIFFIGISRIYLNVHYASDVAAGFAIGAINLTWMICLDRWISEHTSQT